MAAIQRFLLFLFLGVAVYFNARNNPFHYDDHHSIEYNPHLRSLANLPAFFADPGTFSRQATGYMFRPLLLTSYACNYALGGLEVQGYRWVNLLLHIGCSFWVYRLACYLSASEGLALAAGLLFLLHPLHAEPVNYLSSRSDLLASFFALGGIWLVLRGQAKGGVGAYVAGLLSKEVAIVFPLLLAVCRERKGGWREVRAAWRLYLALGLVSVGYLAVIWGNRFLASSLARSPRPFAVHLWTQLKALVYYLWLFGMPVHLNVEHAFAVSPTLGEPVALLAGFFLLSLAYWTWRGRRSLLAWGGSWFAIALLPASLVPLNILVSERRVYLASAGLVLVAAWAWHQWARRRRRWAIGFGIALCLSSALLDLQRNRVWASELSLWEDAARKAPQMPRARLNLAMAYEKAGAWEAAQKELEAGLRLAPDYAEGWVMAGNFRHSRGDSRGAAEAYQKALALDPSLAGVYHNLGNIYLSDWRDPQKAISLYGECLRRDPHFVEARNNLGQAYEAMGRLTEALAQYEQAVADSLYWNGPRDPELGGAWFNLARLNQRLGKREEAATAYRQALALLGQDPRYRDFVEQARRGLAELEE